MAEIQTEIEVLSDGSIQVCVVTDHGRACGFVSSHHLVTPKANQLKGLIDSTVDLSLDPGDPPAHVVNQTMTSHE